MLVKGNFNKTSLYNYNMYSKILPECVILYCDTVRHIWNEALTGDCQCFNTESGWKERAGIREGELAHKHTEYTAWLITGWNKHRGLERCSGFQGLCVTSAKSCCAKNEQNLQAICSIFCHHYIPMQRHHRRAPAHSVVPDCWHADQWPVNLPVWTGLHLQHPQPGLLYICSGETQHDA